VAIATEQAQAKGKSHTETGGLAADFSKREVLVSLKKTPACGEPKRPRIWSFLAELFRMAVFFFSESLGGAKNRGSDGLTKF
jgi:hypothetical protein